MSKIIIKFKIPFVFKLLLQIFIFYEISYMRIDNWLTNNRNK